MRAIDGYSIMSHNSSVTYEDKVTVAGVDAIASLTKRWSVLVSMGRRGPSHALSVRLDAGRVLRGTL